MPRPKKGTRDDQISCKVEFRLRGTTEWKELTPNAIPEFRGGPMSAEQAKETARALAATGQAKTRAVQISPHRKILGVYGA